MATTQQVAAPPKSKLEVPAGAAQSRLAAAVREHHAFVWRCTRRFGVDAASVDDVVQESYIVLSRRLDDVAPGREKAFLTQTAAYLAANHRRAQRRSPLQAANGEEFRVADLGLTPEERLHEERTRRCLDRVLDTLSEELRAVFVLSEIDGLSRTEVAELLALPPGTVASRLRAARERFVQAVEQSSVKELVP